MEKKLPLFSSSFSFAVHPYSFSFAVHPYSFSSAVFLFLSFSSPSPPLIAVMEENEESDADECLLQLAILQPHVDLKSCFD